MPYVIDRAPDLRMPPVESNPPVDIRSEIIRNLKAAIGEGLYQALEEVEDGCIGESKGENILKELDEVSESISDARGRIRAAATAPDLLQAKADLLTRILFRFPCGSDSCPYCLMPGNIDGLRGCPNCEYSAIHRCCFRPGSDYKRFNKALYTLADAAHAAWGRPK